MIENSFKTCQNIRIITLNYLFIVNSFKELALFILFSILKLRFYFLNVILLINCYIN